MPKPPIPNDYLGTSERYKAVSDLSSDIDVVTLYGGPTRSIVCMGNGQLDTEPNSPLDDDNPAESLPNVVAGMGFGISARKILSSTTCGPLLLQF